MSPAKLETVSLADGARDTAIPEVIMVFDQGLAERFRDVLRGRAGVGERRMFGGLAVMLDGSMAPGVIGDTLLARVGPARHADALALPQVRPMNQARTATLSRNSTSRKESPCMPCCRAIPFPP